MALGLAPATGSRGWNGVRLADGVPLAIERASLPTEMLPDPAAVETSLYAVLDGRGLRPVRAVQRISAANLGPAMPSCWRVAPGVAGLQHRADQLSASRPGGGIHPLALSRRCL